MVTCSFALGSLTTAYLFSSSPPAPPGCEGSDSNHPDLATDDRAGGTTPSSPAAPAVSPATAAQAPLAEARFGEPDWRRPDRDAPIGGA
ncbi:MAG: hypothetical protein R3B70_36200 [Polyangiaceae bacterium]